MTELKTYGRNHPGLANLIDEAIRRRLPNARAHFAESDHGNQLNVVLDLVPPMPGVRLRHAVRFSWSACTKEPKVIFHLIPDEYDPDFDDDEEGLVTWKGRTYSVVEEVLEPGEYEEQECNPEAIAQLFAGWLESVIQKANTALWAMGQPPLSQSSSESP